MRCVLTCVLTKPLTLQVVVICGWGLFLRCWSPQPCGGSFNIFGHRRECLNNPIFSNMGLCGACWAHFMCHHELWLILVRHLSSSLNNSLVRPCWRKTDYQKSTMPIFRLVLQNFALPGCFPYILFYRYPFSLLSSGWYVFQSGNYLSLT